MGATRIDEISRADGTSNTLLIGEFGIQNRIAAANFPYQGTTGPCAGMWAQSYPYFSTASTFGTFNARQIELFDIPSYESFRGPHLDNVLFVMVDGSVRAISSSANAIIVDQLAARNDGSVIDSSAW